MYTASFSEARKNLTEIADRVATDGVEYTIFKRSKPLFKIVPVRDEPAGEPVATVAKSLTRREAAERAAARADRVRRTGLTSRLRRPPRRGRSGPRLPLP